MTVAVLANDTDPDGDGLTVSSVTAPENGTAEVAAGGVRYTPAANWHGTDSVRLRGGRRQRRHGVGLGRGDGHAGERRAGGDGDDPGAVAR